MSTPNLSPTGDPLIPYAQLVRSSTSDIVAQVQQIEPTFGRSGVMRAEGAITPKELRQALGGPKYNPLKEWLLLLLVFAVVTVISFFADRWPTMIMGGIIFLVAIYELLKRRSQNNLWRQRRGAFAPRICLFASEGVVLCTNSSLSVFPWEGFRKGRQHHSMVILYIQSVQVILPVPRSHFENQADWERVCAMVAEKFPSP